MKVFLMRHGETTGNSEDLILGQTDYPLTPKGIETSRKLAGLLPLGKKGMILTSPLGRALQTAGIVSEVAGWPIAVHSGMAEIACGEWEGKPRKEVAPGRPFLRLTWYEYPPRGESYSDAEERTRSVVTSLAEFAGYDSFIIIGHGSINRVFLKLWLNMSADKAIEIRQPHELAYILGHDGDVSWINAEGQKGQGLSIEKIYIS